MKRINQTGKVSVSWFFIFLMVVHVSSCSFYQVQKLTRNDFASIQKFRSPDKKIILHAGDESFILWDFKVDSTVLSGNVAKIDSSWYFYHENRLKTGFKSEEKAITNEVHFYLNDEKIDPPYAEIAMNDVREIHVINYDKGKSSLYSIALFVGISVVLFPTLFFLIFIHSYGA